MIEPQPIRKLSTLEELLAAYDVQMQAYGSLHNKEWLEPLDRSFFQISDTTHKTVFGYYVNQVLAGIGILYLPPCQAESLSSEVDIDGGEFLHVAHLEVIATHPTFCNQGIATKLSRAILCEAKERGKYYLMATVHPENNSSLHVLKSLGMQSIKKIKTYGDKERLVMLLSLN